MLSDYKSYIFSLRDNLIQCGVDLSADIEENTSYKDLFFLSLKISDILYFYRVMAVSPDYALRGFMLPLNKNYKDVIRGISYEEFVETILPDYRVLTGDNGDYDLDEDLDDDEDFDESGSESESESESEGVYAEPSKNSSDSTDNNDFSEFGDDLYASMFGSEDDDTSDTPSDTEETVEIASRLDTPVENGIYSTNIGGSYVEDIPLPDIEEIDEIVDWLDDDYDYVDHGSYIEDIKPIDITDSETDNVSDGISEGSNDSEESNVNEDLDYVPNGIYLEEYNPSSNGYNNEETVWDEEVEDSEGYSDEEEVTWDDSEEEEVTWDDSEEEEVTWDDSEEEEVTWDEPEESDGEEEVTWDESEEETWDEPEETWDEPDEEDGEVTWDDSEEEEVWDEPDEEDLVEPAPEETVSTEVQETQVSGGKETEKSLKDRLFGTDDLGEAVQGVTNSVLTKLKRSTISFLNGRNGKV